MAALEHRRFGEYLTAIREDENACEALGVNTFKYKMLAMVVSSFLTGIGGTFYAYYLFSLQPNSVFGIPLSVEIIIRPIVGGAGTVLGPIVGSFILSPLGEISRIYLSPGRLERRCTSSSTGSCSSWWCCSSRRAPTRVLVNAGGRACAIAR